MKTTILALSAAALAALPSAPAAAEVQPQYGQEARIPFAAHGGIRNFRAVGNDVLLIEARGDRWYRAELLGPCFDLRHAVALGFETNADGSFDRWSSIRTRNDVCRVQRLVRIPDPDEQAESDG